MKNLLLTIICLSFLSTFASGQDKDNHDVLNSPNGKIKVEVSSADGRIAYRVSNNNEQLSSGNIVWRIGESTVGKKTVIKEVKHIRRGKITYPILAGHSTAVDLHREMILICQEAEQPFAVEFRAWDDGAAFRLTADMNQATELTDLTTFVIPSSAPQLWYQDRTDCYEGAHRLYTPGEVAEDRTAGPPMLYKTAGGTYVAITEAGLVDFGGMSLRSLGGSAWQSKMEGTTKVGSGHIASPWRCIIAGSLGTLVNTDMITNLSSPEHEIFRGNKSWIVPGVSAWSWLTDDNEISVAGMKRFIDQAAKAGFEYNLVDEGWGHWADPWGGICELVEYGKTKGVGLIVWKAYPDRAGIEGLQTKERREAFFKKCAQVGVVGVKIDFFDGENQRVTKFYADALLDAAKHKILVNFHGCNKPTGLNRTFPNEVTREGVMGLEFGCSWADQNTVIPFTRFVAGHADYTPLSFSKRFMGKTSAAHQVATSIIYTSPLLCYGGMPSELSEHALSEFIIGRPTVWDETVVLPISEVGKTVAFARRSGQDWYLAVITLNEQKDVPIELDFLGSGNYECRMASDMPSDQYGSNKETHTVRRGETLTVSMRQEGGFVAKFSKIPKIDIPQR